MVGVRQSGYGDVGSDDALRIFSEKLETSGQLTKTITVGNPNTPPAQLQIRGVALVD
jgi:hypothetical protein